MGFGLRCYDWFVVIVIAGARWVVVVTCEVGCFLLDGLAVWITFW